MKKYDVILWDVDDTLLDFGLSQYYALKEAFAKYGRGIDAQIVRLYSEINDSYWKRLERGEISKQEVLHGRFKTLFEKMNITDIDVSEFMPLYQTALGSVYFFRDDSYTLCTELKNGFRQYIVTNGVTWTQENKLALSGLDKIVDGIFISEQLGSPKPKCAFFDACFEQIPGLKKERTIIIGDSLTSDMLGGNNAGITCCWYNPKENENNMDVRIDYEIKNLWEVKDILYGEIL